MQEPNYPRQNSINLKNQLFGMISIPVLLTSITLGGLGFFLKQQDIQEQFHARGELILLYYQSLGEQSLFKQDPEALKKFGDTLIQDDSVRSVHLYTSSRLDDSGKPNSSDNKQTLFRSGPRMKPEQQPQYLRDLFAETQRFRGVLKSDSEDKTHLILELELDRNFVVVRQYEILLSYWSVGSICVIFALIFAQLSAGRYSQPIRAISFAIARIQEGRLSTRVKNKVPPGELNELTWGINMMAESLQEANEEMQSSIDQATKDLRSTLETIEVQNIELDFARKEAENANRIKSQFLANISHEIRTPLNSITGFTKLLLKSDLNAKQLDQLQTIHKSSQSLLAIINDILDFSKIEAGKLSLEIANVDIRKVLDEISEMLAPMAKERELSQIINVDDNVPEFILSDPLRIKQVLTNLINNAIKFSEKGTLIIQASIESSKSSQGLIKFSVSDQGIGISDNAKNELFNAFQQSDSSHVRRFQGTGLGLTISRHLVEMLGGEIGVDSTLGEGSTFWFTLPASQPNNISTLSSSNTAISSSDDPNEDTNEQEQSFEKPKLLAVDDNSSNLKLLCALLEDLGLDYDSCNNGRSAINLSKQNEYDLIFMDIQMPDMDGIETTKHIREFDQRFSRNRAIVALTAFASEQEKLNILKDGFNDCLSKPIDMDLLVSTIEHWTAYLPENNNISGESTSQTESANHTQTTPDLNKIIDADEGLRLAGNKADLANEMLELLVNNLPKDWRLIERFARENDTEQLFDKVHYIHGACRYCGVPALRESVLELEKKLKASDEFSLELNNLEKNIFQLVQEYQNQALPIHKA